MRSFIFNVCVFSVEEVKMQRFCQPVSFWVHFVKFKINMSPWKKSVHEIVQFKNLKPKGKSRSS